MRFIHGEYVHGAVLDAQTRCAHYGSDLDIVAIRFKCCDKWFPCRDCHDECVTHVAQTWQESEFSTKAVLCGACGNQLSIEEYLSCKNECPSCERRFNPGCADHCHLYFDVKGSV